MNSLSGTGISRHQGSTFHVWLAEWQIILAIYDCEQSFDVWWGFQSMENTPLVLRSNSFETWSETKFMSNVYKLRTEVFCKQILSLLLRDRQNYFAQEAHWQIFPSSLQYCISNRVIILICMFVKISTNPSLRVRPWPWCLHESEIQVQSNQRFSFLIALWLVFTAAWLSHSSFPDLTNRQKW